ncbi:MAG: divergent polysaccharide deacetylase family protein [Pseudomonadota bacterium]
MRTGTFGGFFVGTAVSAVVLGLASVLTYPAPEAADGPDATAVNVPAGSEFRQSRDDTEASLPGADDVPDPADQQNIEAPEPDDIASIDAVTSAPAAQPTLDGAEPELTAPETPDAPSGIDPDVEQPVLSSPQTLAPQVPAEENDLSISTEPAQPLLPDISEGNAFEEEVQASVLPETATAPDVQTDAASEVQPVTVPEVETDTAPDLQTDFTESAPVPAPVPDEDALPEEAAQPTPEEEQPELTLEAEVEPETAAEPEVEEDTAPEGQAEVTEAAPVPDEDALPEEVALSTPEEEQPELTPQAEAEPETAAVPEVEEDTPPEVEAEVAEPAPVPEDETLPDIVAQPTPEEEPGLTPQTAVELEDQTETEGTIGNLAQGVTVGRLPSVTAPDETAEEPAVEGAPEPAPEGEQRPLDQFSAEFDNPDGKPLMAFVLLDQGDSPISYDALADFPYPISYAVDVTWSGAEAAMSTYRAAGLDVLAMIDLPEDAGAVDTEVAMQTYLAALPETVAVMEGVRTGLQSSREATEQLIPILQESGHGLVLFSEGFDTAQKLISREGVPALSVFRDIDGNEQNATVIRRFLDQAAFRASQEEVGVIVVGRLRAETVSALLLWGLQDRANSVAIAPVSALLKAQVEE